MASLDLILRSGRSRLEGSAGPQRRVIIGQSKRHPPPYRARCLRKPRGVARHQIDLEVELVADLPLAPGGDRQRVRNDQHREHVVVDRVHRERRAVEADRALFGDELGQLRRHLDVESRRRPPRDRRRP